MYKTIIKRGQLLKSSNAEVLPDLQNKLSFLRITGEFYQK